MLILKRMKKNRRKKNLQTHNWKVENGHSKTIVAAQKLTTWEQVPNLKPP